MRLVTPKGASASSMAFVTAGNDVAVDFDLDDMGAVRERHEKQDLKQWYYVHVA